MSRKLIVPTEVQVCATCSYWDGERKVDAEVGVVVVDECCQGECLVRESSLPALRHKSGDSDCEWEHLVPDEPEDVPAVLAELPPDDEKAA
ncbi:hypothetical protein AZSI13_12960 [Azospira sp. I13]|uniref:hypothetical protein n=1 Tax=Azospira sp. I13 TaxID=1765050 RepID=UPI000D40D9A1|nr:hypothetical protein [Azospira sp. I13]GBG01969.1 hypothetical protein AZSI13_12960 [Azospira sp. I13]